jgi:hypothetical protein
MDRVGHPGHLTRGSREHGCEADRSEVLKDEEAATKLLTDKIGSAGRPQVRIGFRASIIAVFIAVVLLVGLTEAGAGEATKASDYFDPTIYLSTIG